LAGRSARDDAAHRSARDVGNAGASQLRLALRDSTLRTRPSRVLAHSSTLRTRPSRVLAHSTGKGTRVVQGAIRAQPVFAER